MKKLTLLAVLLVTVAVSAQEYNPYKFAVLNSTLISPNIDLDKGRSVVVTNADEYSGYFQYEFDLSDRGNYNIDTNDIRDGIMIGGVGINHSYDLNSYMGYIGGIAGKFRGSLNIGYLDSYSGYKATSTSFNVSWHFKDNTFIGLNVNNLHNVNVRYSSDYDSEYYSKMTPKLFASYAITENWIVAGDISSRVNDIQVKYLTEDFSAGAYYSGNAKQGVFGTYRLWRFNLLASVNTIGTKFDDVVFGLKFE